MPKVVKVFLKPKSKSEESERVTPSSTDSFISDKTITVALPTYGSIEVFNRTIAYFSDITKLKAICNKRLLECGNIIKVKINIEFPKKIKFAAYEAYSYLSMLLTRAGIENEIDEDPKSTPIESKVDFQKYFGKIEIECNILNEDASREFDVIISIIEIIHNITIDIVRDFSERGVNSFKRNVIIHVPSCAVKNLVDVLESRRFLNTTDRK